MIQLSRIEQLSALAEHGTFRRAARALGIAQPTLTRAIQVLEKELGAALLHRTRPRIELTEIGRAMVERGRALLAESRDLEEEIRAMIAGEAGRVCAGFGVYPAELSLPKAVSRFTESRPGVKLEVRVANFRELLPRLLSGDIDFAVINTDDLGGDRELTVEPLRRREGALFCRRGHPILRRQPVGPEHLAQYPLAAPALPPRVQRALGRGEDAELVCGSLSAIEAAVVRTDAIGVTVLELLDRGAGLASFEILDWVGAELSGAFGIVTRKRASLSSATRAFIEDVRVADGASVLDE